jgi:hypothetical protein
MSEPEPTVETVGRVQTGVRLEKKLVKVLKALAEFYDESLGEFLEDLVLSTFAGHQPFSDSGLSRVADIMRIYGMDHDRQPATPKA